VSRGDDGPRYEPDYPDPYASDLASDRAIEDVHLPDVFICPRCGRVSHHPEDLRQGYCGACHDFTGAPA